VERKTVRLTIPSRLLRQLEQARVGQDRIGLASQINSMLAIDTPYVISHDPEPSECVTPRLSFQAIEKLDALAKLYNVKRSVIVTGKIEQWLTMNVQLVQTPRPRGSFKRGNKMSQFKRFRKYPGSRQNMKHLAIASKLLKIIKTDLGHPEITLKHVTPYAKNEFKGEFIHVTNTLANECLRSIDFPGLPPAYTRWLIDNHHTIDDSLLFEWRMNQQQEAGGFM
jgi:hypothetical protein